MEVVKGIHRIQAPLGDRFVCVYLLAGADAYLLVDTGLDDTPRTYIEPYMKQAGLDPEKLRWVITSHADFDHVAGNRSIKEFAPHVQLLCHALDVKMVEDLNVIIADRYDELLEQHGIGETDASRTFMRENTRTAPVDLCLSGGESMRLAADWSVSVWHTPGHSRGHISIFDPRSNALVICDAALFNAVLRADGKAAFPPTYRYVETYVPSIQRLQAAKADTLLTSHYPVFLGSEVEAFLAESRAFVGRIDHELRKALTTHADGLTMLELTAMLSPKLGVWPEGANHALSQPLIGHLEQLISVGKVHIDGERNGHVIFHWPV